MNAHDKKLLALLEKWHTGNYTRADEQALQQLLANGDDFSRETVEGFFSLPEDNHAQNLALIRKKILPPTQIAFLKFRNWAFAAAIALLLVAAFFITKPLSKEKPLAHIPTDTNPTAPSTPSTSMTANENAPAPTPPTNPPIQMDDYSSNRAEEFEVKKDQLEERVADVPATAGASPSEMPPARSEPTPAQYPRQPVPTADNAIIRSEPQKQERFDPSTAESLKTKPLGKAIQKNANKKSEKPSDSAPSPAGGWDNFRLSMARQLSLPQKARENNVRIAISKLILDIEPATGKIRSIHFLDKAGFGCDELAETFVHQFNWIVVAGGPTEVEVEIVFK